MKRIKQILLLTVILVSCMFASLLGLNSQQLINQTDKAASIRVFLEDGSAEQLASGIASLQGVSTLRIQTSSEVMAEFEDRLGYEWDGPNPLPETIEVMVNPFRGNDVFRAIQSMDGIEHVSYDPGVMRITAILNAGLRIGGSLILFLTLFMNTVFMVIVFRKWQLSLGQTTSVTVVAGLISGYGASLLYNLVAEYTLFPGMKPTEIVFGVTLVALVTAISSVINGGYAAFRRKETCASPLSHS